MAIVYQQGKAYADNRATDKKPPTRAERPVVIRRPKRTDYGTPSREGVDTALGDANRFLAEYQAPRLSARFADTFGAGSAAIARGESERVREAREIASRRGYVGGHSDVGERSAREGASERARLGFDTANAVASDASRLYDSAAGRYQNLMTAYNEQLGLGDRAYGSALADRSTQMGEQVRLNRNEQQRQLEESRKFAEDQRQYDLSLKEKAREFDVGEGGVNKRFETEQGGLTERFKTQEDRIREIHQLDFEEQRRQFNETADETRRRHAQEDAAAAREAARQDALLARALGLPVNDWRPGEGAPTAAPYVPVRQPPRTAHLVGNVGRPR